MEPDYVSEEIAEWQRGRELRSVVCTPSWEIICDTIRRYADAANEDLMKLAPGDPRVPQAHAAASAAEQIAINFKRDIEQAVEKSYTTPESLKVLAALGNQE